MCQALSLVLMQATGRSLHPDRPLPEEAQAEKDAGVRAQRGGSGGGDCYDEIRLGKMTERHEWGWSSDHFGENG